MNKIKYLFLIVAIGFTVLSCSPFKVVSDYDQKTDFTQYKTFSLRVENLKINDIDKSRVVDELERQLKAKGLQESDNPDLIVNVKATHKIIRDNYVTPSIGFGGWGNWFGWGIGLSRTYSNEYNRGSLIFDFIDAKTDKLVWQGIGSGLNVDSPKSKKKQIPEIITEMLKNFPPKKK